MFEKILLAIKKVYPYLVASAVILLIGLSFYSSLQTFQTTSKDVAELSGDDMVTAWDKRQRKVRLLLPGYGVIGYLADWDIPNYKYSPSDQEVEFLLAQYTVAPLVLERGIQHDLILGNFNDTGDPQKLRDVQDYFGIQLVKSFSNEIFLFKGMGK